MKLLKSALAIVGPSERPGRERLRAAREQREVAEREVEAAKEAARQLERVVAEGHDASASASEADAALKVALAAWGRGDRQAQADYERLRTIADEANREAEHATAAAQAAAKNLVIAADLLKSRQFDLRSCEEEISAAIGEVIAAEASPLLERFERIAEEYRAVRIEIKALQRVLEPGRYEDACAKSDAGTRLVDAALGRGAILSWDKERDAAQAHDFVEGARGRDESALEKLIVRWRERAQALRANPDAQL